jgi:hypothetical protein
MNLSDYMDYLILSLLILVGVMLGLLTEKVGGSIEELLGLLMLCGLVFMSGLGFGIKIEENNDKHY